MEIGGVEINFPEQLKNVILNEYVASIAENEVEAMKVRAMLKVYNKNGVSTETALKIIKENTNALAEIENLYGGGEPT
jgi:hypothetical protein